MSRIGKLWFWWVLTVFVLFNSWAGHQEKRSALKDAAEAWQKLDQSAPDPLVVWRWVRCYGTDDDDVQRYQAYCNAVLGRPYSTFYVRPPAEWAELAFASEESTPDTFPLRQPAQPLAPYRDFLVEYPPGFFVFALPPALLTSDPELYRTLFSSLMGLCLTGSLLLCMRMARQLGGPPPEQMLAWSLALVLTLGVVSVRRYDAGVAVLVCWTLWGCLDRRPIAAGLALGLASAAKLIPLLLWPLCAIHLVRQRRTRELGRLTLAAGLTLAALLVPFGRPLWGIWLYHCNRPLQIESSAAALLGLWHSISSRTLEMAWTFGSANVVGGYARAAAWLTTTVMLVALFSNYVMAGFRTGPRVLLEGVCATLALVMVFGKVFSPQYLVWLLPVGCLASLQQPGRRRWVLLAIMALTQLIYPIFYSWLKRFDPGACTLVLMRNGLLLYWVWLGQERFKK